MDKALTDFITEYRDYITLFTGIVLAVGAVKNWNWLCNPVGKPDAAFKPRYVPAYFWRAWFNTYILRCNDDIWMNG